MLFIILQPSATPPEQVVSYSLQLYESSAFVTPVGSYPHMVASGDDVFVQASINTTTTDFGVNLVNCWIEGAQNHRNIHTLVEHG